MAISHGTRRSYLSDYIVLMAMAVVAVAVGFGLVFQFGFDLIAAVAVATSGFAAATTGHILLRRSESLAQLRAELARQDAGGETAGAAAEANDPTLPVDFQENGDEAKLQPPPLGEYRPSDPALEDAGENDGDGPEESLARLKIGAPPKLSTGSKAHVSGGKSGDIGPLISRLAKDISAGRRGAEGVAINQVLEPKPITAEDFALQSEAGGGPPSLKDDAGVPEAAGPVDATDKLAAVTDALANEQVDVFLEPILGLDDRQARHYEVTIRLALDDDESMGQDAYTEVTRGSVLLPLIDAVKVSHTKKIGLQLLRRGRSGALMSQINGESVSGEEFGEDLAAIMGNDQVMAGRLVLSFSQGDIRGFTAAQWASIDKLAMIGFRFAASDITDLDMDFDLLGQKGFAFAKLDSDVFLKGLPTGETVVPPGDICRHLAGAGLTLIVNHVDSDRALAEVLGFGALFGQGALFGGPRPVKAHVLKTPGESVEQSQAPMG